MVTELRLRDFAGCMDSTTLSHTGRVMFVHENVKAERRSTSCVRKHQDVVEAAPNAASVQLHV